MVDAGRDGQGLWQRCPGVGRARGFAWAPGWRGCVHGKGGLLLRALHSFHQPSIHPSHMLGRGRVLASPGRFRDGETRRQGDSCLAAPSMGVLGIPWGGRAGQPQAGRPAWGELAHTPVLPLQLEQFNMMENAISSSSLYSPGSTLNYSQAAMMGLTGSHGSLPDTQQLGYPSHSSIPNIILTGEAPRQGVFGAGPDVSVPVGA